MRRLTPAVLTLLAITLIEPAAYCFQAATSQTDSSGTVQGKKTRTRKSSKDTTETASTSTAPKSKSGGKQAPNGEKIDLNAASESQLDSLPGVGPATAKKIIAARPYSSAGDLSKAGLSAKTIANITPMVSVGATQAAAPANVPQQPATSRVKPSSSANVTSTQSQGGGPGMVWVNPETKVFHRSGDRWYGKTKTGQYMTESDAIKAGYRESNQKTSSK